MTLEEWKVKYEKEAESLIITPGFSCYYEPDKGFFYWRVLQDVFEVDHSCTNDYKHFLNIANKMAKARGCKLIRTPTKHSPASFMRMFKCTTNISLSMVRPNGVFYWVMEKEVK